MSLKSQRSLKERFEDNKGVNKSRGIVDFIYYDDSWVDYNKTL